MKLEKKKHLLQKRRWRIRKKIFGTLGRPRLTVCFTHQHIHAQCIDDEKGITQVACSTNSKDLKGKGFHPNASSAVALGQLIAERASTAGIKSVVFDRAGRKYHGRLKAFADAAREAGLNF